MYQLEVDVDMLNTVESVLAEILSVIPSSEHLKSVQWPGVLILLELKQNSRQGQPRQNNKTNKSFRENSACWVIRITHHE